MRQIGEDFRQDPFKSVTGEAVGMPKVDAATAAYLDQWKRNTFLKVTYQQCSNAAGLDLSKATMSDMEK